MNGLHDDVVVSIGASRDDVLRLLPEEPKRDAGDGHAAARSDGQRKEALTPFCLLRFHAGSVSERGTTVSSP